MLPKIDQVVQIHSFKHDQKMHRVWDSLYILSTNNDIIIGYNNKANVIEYDGKVWWTKEPAICIFYPDRWYNVIGMLREDGIYYYCNLSSPYLYEKDIIKYIDYDLDIKVFPNMSYRILDTQEFEKNMKKYGYHPKIVRKVYQELELLIKEIEEGKGPFAPMFLEYWRSVFETRRAMNEK